MLAIDLYRHARQRADAEEAAPSDHWVWRLASASDRGVVRRPASASTSAGTDREVVSVDNARLAMLFATCDR